MVEYTHTLEEEIDTHELVELVDELEDMQELEECDISDLNIGEQHE